MSKRPFGDPRLPQRFWDKVEVVDSGCWEWVGSHFKAGYGGFALDGKTEYAHRLSYALVKEIPNGYQIDHVCRNRGCVNPEHLEAVTQQENLRRGAQGFALTGTCQSGLHDVTDPGSIYVSPRGSRLCRECQRISNRRATRKYRQKKRGGGTLVPNRL